MNPGRRVAGNLFGFVAGLAARWRRAFPRLRGHNLIYYLLRKCEPEGYIPGVVRRAGKWWHLHGLRNNCESAIFYGRIQDSDFETHDILMTTVQPGDVVVDVGANIGYYTALLSDLVGSSGSVYAFEPSPVHFAALCRNMAIQGRRNVHLREAALADARRDVVHYTTHASGSLVSSFAEYGQACLAETRLTTFPLDELLPPELAARVSLIKIDVDGNEIEVIEGARRVIEAGRPALLLEIADRTQRAAGATALRLLRTVEDLGYRFFLDPGEAGAGADEILPRIEQRLVFADVLCLPLASKTAESREP